MSVQTTKRGRPRKPQAAQAVISDYYTIDELSNFLKLSKSHIYTLTSQKKIPHIKLLNKKILFDKAEIRSWLNSKSVPTK